MLRLTTIRLKRKVLVTILVISVYSATGWTQGTTAGHPGFNTSGPRTWNAGALCGMIADDQTHSTCP